jgi:hypothetical protein
MGQLRISRYVLCSIMSLLINRIFPFADRDRWSADKWRRHLLSKADTQAERDDIIAMFVD